MTRSRKLALAALALGATLAAGAAHARGVQWQLTLVSPGTVLGLPLPPVPVVVPRAVVQPPLPVVYAPPPAPYGWRERGRRHWDRDRDGIADRYDRHDDRRWDGRR